jgi:hypothetical protein
VFRATELCDELLAVKLPSSPALLLVTVQWLAEPQDVEQDAVAENCQVWYPNGTGIEFDVLDCHIKNMVASKARLSVE